MKEKIEQLIEETLRQEPHFKLGIDFKDGVVKAIKQRERRSQRKLYILMAVGIVAILAIGVGSLAFFGSLAAFKSMAQLAPLSVLIGSIIVLIQYLDKRLVKDKYFRQPV